MAISRSEPISFTATTIPGSAPSPGSRGFKQDLGKKTEFAFGYRRHTDEFILLRNDPAVYENNHSDESWQTSLRRQEPLGQNPTLFYGGEGFHESIDSNNLGQHARSRGAVYADYDHAGVLAASLFPWARARKFSAPRRGVLPQPWPPVYWLKAGFKLKGSVSRAFRLPSYTDLYYSDPAKHRQSQPATRKRLGLRRRPALGPWRTLQGGGTMFERRERNDIDYVRASPSDQWHAENIDLVNFTGAETALTIRLPRRQNLKFAYTALHGRQNR